MLNIFQKSRILEEWYTAFALSLMRKSGMHLTLEAFLTIELFPIRVESDSIWINNNINYSILKYAYHSP